MGMSGDTALTLAKSYVKKTLQGQGALKGQDGFSPIVTENKDNTDEIYKLDITTKDGTFTTPNLIGAGGSGEENVIESIKVNGVAQNVAVDKSVDITVPTKTSDLSNDSNYQTADDITATLAPYAKSADVTTATKEQFATASGDYITVNDSVDGKIRDLKLYGKSEQKQYSGKNLLNAPELLNVSGSLNVICDIPAGTYILSKESLTSTDTDDAQCAIRFFYEDNSYKALNCDRVDVHTEQTIAFDNKIVKASFFCASGGGTSTGDTSVWKGLMLSTSGGDYEPYVGGIPSPNPNYPQEIKSVVNPVVKVCGKNLLNPTLGTSTKNGVTCTANGDGTYTLNGTATENATFYLQENIPLPIGKFRFLGCPKGGEISTKYSLQFYRYLPGTSVHDIGEGKTYNNTSTMIFSRVIINIYKGYTCNNLVFKPMITTDLSATYDDFEPYKETTATLPYTLNAIPVESGGNVTIDGQEYIADYVDFENKKLVRRVKKKDLGEFDWNYIGNDVPELKYFNATILDSFMPTESHPIGEGFCDLYSVEKNNIPKPDLANNKVAIGWFNLSSTRCCLEIRDDNYTDAIDFKNAVKGHYVYYQLATPTTIDLTDEQVQAFKELQTYYPTTNVFVTSDQLNGYAECKYPTTDVSGIASKNEAKIAEIEKNVTSVNNDLGGLKFSVSDGTLSITDGVNTWTLPQTT